jgi:hypothetical protein
MATGTAGTSARSLRSPVVHSITYQLAYNTTGASSGVQIGTLPAGALIIGWNAHITTLFNAGTTNPITIGTTATGNEIAASGSITSGTAGAYSSANVNAAGARGILAADTPIYTAYIPTGTAASTGAAVLSVTYVLTDV